MKVALFQLKVQKRLQMLQIKLYFQFKIIIYNISFWKWSPSLTCDRYKWKRKYSSCFIENTGTRWNPHPQLCWGWMSGCSATSSGECFKLLFNILFNSPSLLKYPCRNNRYIKYISPMWFLFHHLFTKGYNTWRIS